MALPALDPASPHLSGRHLLVLPGDVGHEEVLTLAVSRFPRAAWEVQPTTASVRATGRRGPRAWATPAGVLRLSRHSTLEGPFTVDELAASALALPPSAHLAYLLRGLVERGERPWPGGGDRDGLRRGFPDGLPVRDEGRTVTWLVDAARRLGGGVRVASSGALLVPDPAAAVDLTVWSDIWLDPDAALSVMRQAVPRATLNLPVARWAGPPARTGERPVPGAEALDVAARRALHTAADDVDLAALADPPPMDRYGALADLDIDGVVALEVGGETALPPVIVAVPWAARGAVAYRISWTPPDLHEMEAEHPGMQHRVARSRVTPLVIAVTRAVHGAVGGEITDMMGFIVDPADL